MCADALSAATVGDFLVRANKDNTKFHLMVKDQEGLASFGIVRQGRQFLFGGKSHGSLDQIVANLQATAVRGLDGKPLTLASPVQLKRVAGAAPTQPQPPQPLTPAADQPASSVVAAAANTGPARERVPSDEVSMPPPSPKRKSLPAAPGAKRLPPTPPLQQEQQQQRSSAADGGGATTVAAADFIEYVNGVRAAGQIRNMFEQLDAEAAQNTGTKKVADLPQNKRKNRYSNVHPYDHTRVVLQRAAGSATDGAKDGDDLSYINACWVDGFGRPKEYIASQGPKEETVADFWWMVWQERATMIAMLNKLKENGRSKCAKYWPEPGERAVYGAVAVTGLEPADGAAEATQADGIITREFTVALVGAGAEGEQQPESSAPRRLVQYQFTGWPDFGVPSTADGLLDILAVVESKTSDESGPLVVHCSAGIGRTGTFCTIDTNIKMLRQQGSLDILGTVAKLRTQRPGMVQTKEQLDFCFQALVEVIEGNEADAANSFV
jgi:protein tyrosine phosphatase